MPTIPERLTALERDQLAQEKANRQAMEAHAKENSMALEAVQTRINEVEQRVEALAPVLGDMSGKLDTLVRAKVEQDAVKGDRRGKKMELKDYVIIAIGFGSMVGAIAQAIK